MSLYLDTSCLLKLLFAEPESAKTSLLVAAEPRVVVSSLARLEALVQIQGRAAGRLLSARAAAALARLLDQTLVSAPFDLVTTPAGIDGVATAQLFLLSRSVHCRTLDRLHLAAMQSLGVRRLLTNDETQARAASALGFEVLRPRQ
jgi:predicted nucleic acid-binding protein